jgi:prepilin-type N-terminal cleavage/methylation domain-containing protein
MSHYARLSQSGFSAVELLITLFIAAAFVATGYQLYSVIIQNSESAREKAKASNIAYDNLRRYAPQATNPCSTATPSPTPTIPSGSNLPNASISVVISCPYGTSLGLSKVTATVTYGNPQESVIHALFVND